METDPRPRMSVKAVCWLSDIPGPGRGNLNLVPGSQTANRIDGPPRRDVPWPPPAGAVEVVARPGDVVLFDRRIWHARSVYRSAVVRKAVFFGYTYGGSASGTGYRRPAVSPRSSDSCWACWPRTATTPGA